MILVAIGVVLSTAIGAWSRHRFGAVAERATDRGMHILIYYLTPPLTYFVMANLKFDSGVGLGIGLVYVVVAITGLIAYFLATRVFHLDRPGTGSLVIVSFHHNTGYLGVPLAAAVLGHDAIGPAVAYDVFVSQTVTLVAVFAIGAALGTKAGDNTRERLISFARNPVLLAAILGILAPDALAPQAATDFAKDCYTFLLPAAFIALGVHLMGEREDGTMDFPPTLTGPVAAAIGLRIALAPALFLLLTSLLVDVPDVYLLQAAMPAGVFSLMVAHIYGLDLKLVASAIAWSTTIVVTIALLAGFVT